MPHAAINISIELLSCIIILLLLILQLDKENKTWQDKLFALVLATCMLQIVFDAAAWWVDDRPGAMALFLSHIINFIVNSIVTFSMFFFLLYISVHISPKGKFSNTQRYLLYCIGILSIQNFIMSILNIWNGMLYHIDENNHYHWGDWYILQYVVVWIQSILIMIHILHSRSRLAKKDMWAFLSFVGLPGVAAIVIIWDSELMLQYPAVMLSLLLIYINVQKEQEKQLAMELAESRTTIMLSQIKPHFLYNSLTAIGMLCDIDSKGAKEAVNDFADYLRGNLESLSQRELIPFEKELIHVETYLALEKLRFGEKLHVKYDIETEDFMLPSLTVQPIVENAVQHGLTQNKSDGTVGGTLTVRVEEVEKAYIITIVDDGAGYEASAPKTDGREHIGIENVRRRLAILCNGVMETESIPDMGTTVTITIPKK